jgi:hypothetical protein
VATAKKNSGFIYGTRKFLLNTKALIHFQPTINKDPNSKLVLVLSFPRSGTHALASMIEKPEIGLNYYGEFFMFNHWSQIVEKLNRKIPYFSFRFYINSRAQKRKWTLYRFEKTSLDVFKTIDATLTFTGTHIFKLFPEHLKFETLEEIIRKYQPRVIYLRRNHLDRYVSLKKANASGNWHKSNSTDVQIEINDDELMHYKNKYDDWYKKMKAVTSNCQVLDINFAELHNESTTRRIQEFILGNTEGLTALPKEPTTTKMDKSSKLQDEYLAGKGMHYTDFDFLEIK